MSSQKVRGNKNKEKCFAWIINFPSEKKASEKFN